MILFFLLAALTGEARVSCPAPAKPKLSLQESGVTAVGAIKSQEHLSLFLATFEKVPGALRKELLEAGGKIRIIEGKSVLEDPTWKQDYPQTISPDGRELKSIVGTAGDTIKGKITATRIVLSELEGKNHGSINLVLHEMGHAFDRLHEIRSLSNSKGWESVVKESKGIRGYMLGHCGSLGCGNSEEETFAELFAIYHSCPEGEKELRSKFPKLAAFFGKLTSVKDYLSSPEGKRKGPSRR